jgi:hypothetical protein
LARTASAGAGGSAGGAGAGGAAGAGGSGAAGSGAAGSGGGSGAAGAAFALGLRLGRGSGGGSLGAALAVASGASATLSTGVATTCFFPFLKATAFPERVVKATSLASSISSNQHLVVGETKLQSGTPIIALLQRDEVATVVP